MSTSNSAEGVGQKARLDPVIPFEGIRELVNESRLIELKALSFGYKINEGKFYA